MIRTALLAGLIALTMPTLAHAQPSPPPLGDSLTGPARDDYKTALLLYEDRDYTGALVKFKSAHERSGDPRLLWNIAACEKSLRRYVHVLRIVERYQRETEGKLSEDRRREAEALVRTVRSLVSTVHLTVDQPGAAVYVDDELAGTTPLPESLLVDLGQRRLRVSKSGFKDWVLTQDFGGGSDTTTTVTLVPALREAHLTVDAAGRGTISLDGRVVGEGRWEGPVAAGAHAVRVSATGMQTRTTDVAMSDGEARTLYLSLEHERPRGLPALFWVGGGVLVAGLATGAYFLFRPASAPGATVGTLSPGTVQLP